MSVIHSPSDFEWPKLSRVVLVGAAMFACGTFAGLELAPISMSHAQTHVSLASTVSNATLSVDEKDPAQGVLGEPYQWDRPVGNTQNLPQQPTPRP